MENYHLLVLDALTKASSQNAELIKLAEQQLKCLETERGFYSTLMVILLDKSIDVNIRWLASVCLKNGVDRYWRKAAPNCMSAEEKKILREKLLICFCEPVNQIAAQIAIIISKVARLDSSNEWPELFPALSNAVQQPNDLVQQRSLLVMHHVIKVLSTKRLPPDRRVFTQLTCNIFSNILHLWVNYSNLFLHEAKNVHQNHKLLLEKCLFCLKILRKLVVYGFKDISKESDAVNFLALIFQQFRPFIDCRKHMIEHEDLLETCEKYLFLLAKVLRDVLELHPFSFVQFVRPTLECAVTFCFTSEYKDVMFERLTVQLLNLIKAIILCQEYRPAVIIEDTKNPLTLEANQILADFFAVPVLREICQQLVIRYFLLSESDLKNWEENPEEFASDEVGESWKFSLRPCTEVLFVSLFRKFRDTLCSFIMELVNSIQNSRASDFMSILRKEAVYTAVGLVAFELFDEIDFDQWFIDVLIPELNVKTNGCYIIRRRVIWLVGQWVWVKMSFEKRALLYEVVMQLMKSEENLVVRITAANTLKSAVEETDFSVDQFLPFLEASITVLFNLLKEVKECDLKMSVLNVLCFIIERVGYQVRPYANSLMQYLPQLWDNCGEHNLLRCAIISCFVQLVQCLGVVSENLQPLLIPMVSVSIDVFLPPHIYLLEDGLELWEAILCNTTTCSQELLILAKKIMPLLEYGSENLKKSLEIVDAYLLLAPKIFLQEYGEQLVKTFVHILTDMRSEAIVCVMKVVETTLMVFPVESPALFKPVLSIALNLILGNEELPVAVSVYLSLLSRTIMHNQKCFRELLEEKAAQFNQRTEKILADLLDIWFEKMPFVNPQEKRKVLGLALACLLTSGSGVVHYRLAGILLAVVEVLNDISITVCTSNSYADSLVIGPDDFVEDEEQEDEEVSEHDKRKRELCRQDPVYTVVLRDYLRTQVCALEQQVGSTEFQDLISTVDVETMQQLREYLQI